SPPAVSRSRKNNSMDYASSETTVMPLDLLREITNDFSEERRIGSGSYGKVYLGVHQHGKRIAVKILYDMPGIDDEQFQNEFNNLTRLRHQNIVRLVGYCHNIQEIQVEYKGKLVLAEKTHRALCLEYMSNGSLDKYLSGNEDVFLVLVGILIYHFKNLELENSPNLVLQMSVIDMIGRQAME
uniref:Protein kinase domain-containing protein n=1 Tax=Aegilops tauschii subsp. strangulata TaxID=200361 RepID=A0A453T3T4_AEGTS